MNTIELKQQGGKLNFGIGISSSSRLAFVKIGCSTWWGRYNSDSVLNQIRPKTYRENAKPSGWKKSMLIGDILILLDKYAQIGKKCFVVEGILCTRKIHFLRNPKLWSLRIWGSSNISRSCCSSFSVCRSSWAVIPNFSPAFAVQESQQRGELRELLLLQTNGIHKLCNSIQKPTSRKIETGGVVVKMYVHYCHVTVMWYRYSIHAFCGLQTTVDSPFNRSMDF